MKSRKILFLLLIAAVLLSGCTMSTTDQMYCLPKRSQEYNNLQSAIDKAMSGLEYCAPRSGEYQQTVQMADLDGDGSNEYLVFAKENNERPLRVLIFDKFEDSCRLVDTIECNGTAFDMVEYIQMDGKPGLELVIGRQLSDQVVRSVSVYSFSGKEAEQLFKANYAKAITVDLDMDGMTELLVLRPVQADVHKGVAELYGVEDGTIERSNEVNMSCSTEQMKRVLVGRLDGGQTAVYIASSVDEASLVTDVYAYADEALVNVSFSNESGTSVQTMRNYYVYADDIDNDGIVELPDLIPMQTIGNTDRNDRHNLIRWYAMQLNGDEVDKMFTYHNFLGGWYLELGKPWASRLNVEQQGNEYHFYIWSESFEEFQKIMTIHELSGQNRDEQRDGRFILLKTDTVSYQATLEPAAAQYQITQESMIRNFHLIQQEWKTGET